MATKTISIDLKAYERLSRARRHPRESFSQVIHRAIWIQGEKTCGSFLERLKEVPALSDEAIERLERAQEEDVPPGDKWSIG